MTDNEVHKICAFYSHGPHFVRLLKHLRATYPAAHLTTFTPPGFPPEVLRGYADRMAYTGRRAYPLRELRPLLRLIEVLRRERFDLFVVMFDSPRLRLLARLSGAKRAMVYTVDGRTIPLHGLALGSLLAAFPRRIRGIALYAWMWFNVHCRPVRRERS
jgi:hypothetical protein